MLTIHTASWFTKLPPSVQRIGISRGTPRGQPAGYRMLRDLAPGPWFKSVTPQRYLDLYNEQLSQLDPRAIVDRMTELAGDKDAVAILCFESPHDCHVGNKWCHRHVAAQWLSDTLDITVEEAGFPNLDPWTLLRNNGIEPPRYRASGLPIVPEIDLTDYIGKTTVADDGHWKVIGSSKEFPDQAQLENVLTGEIRTVSANVLRSREFN